MPLRVDPSLLLDDDETIWHTPSLIIDDAQFQTVSATAYFCFIRTFRHAVTINHIYALMRLLGSGTETKELGLFSTPLPPNYGNQTLTKLTAVGDASGHTNITDITSGTAPFQVKNLTSLAYTVAAGTNLWAGIREAMSGTRPKWSPLCGDQGSGFVLTTTSATAFTSGTSYAGVVPTIISSLQGNAPGLIVTSF